MNDKVFELRLQAWLSAHFPERENLQLSDFTAPEAGASNETLLFSISWLERGESHSQALVARLKPEKQGIFPSYDLPLQYRTMERLAETDVKVPRMVGLETDESVLGKPFYIMECIEGRYMADNPPYQMEGWLTEQSPETCGGIWRNAISQMAAINRVDWQPLGFADLWNKDKYPTPLAELLAYYEEFLGWAESLGRPFPKLYPVLKYLKENQPKDEPVALLWGDAKPPNLMVDNNGCDVLGVLDWEMVHLGNPVHDLCWWIVLDDSLTDGLGLPKVEGLPDRQAMIEQWQRESGHSAKEIDYYLLLSNFQFALIMHRVGTMLTEQGIFPADAEFDLNNNSTLLIDAQIEKFGIS